MQLRANVMKRKRHFVKRVPKTIIVDVAAGRRHDALKRWQRRIDLARLNEEALDAFFMLKFVFSK